jgi:hypothetical protein
MSGARRRKVHQPRDVENQRDAAVFAQIAQAAKA